MFVIGANLFPFADRVRIYGGVMGAKWRTFCRLGTTSRHILYSPYTLYRFAMNTVIFRTFTN